MIEGFDSRYWDGRLPVGYAGKFKFWIGKATEADYFANCIAPWQNDKALSLGMHTGAFHFHRQASQPTNAARLYHHFLKPMALNMRFPILDCEDQRATPGMFLASHIWASVQAIEQKFGLPCMIYTARWWWDSHVFFPANHPIYTRPLWESDPPPETKDPGHFGQAKITQYALDLKPTGFNATIDLDRADEAWYMENVMP